MISSELWTSPHKYKVFGRAMQLKMFAKQRENVDANSTNILLNSSKSTSCIRLQNINQIKPTKKTSMLHPIQSTDSSSKSSLSRQASKLHIERSYSNLIHSCNQE